MNHYWDIRDFLAEEQVVEVVFMKDALGMDFLDKTKGFDGYVPKEHPIAIPVWKANILFEATEGENCMEIKIPEYYKAKSSQDFIVFLNGLDNPTPGKSNIDEGNLMRKNQFFYELAALLRKPLSASVDHAELSQLAEIYIARTSLIISRNLDDNSKENDLARKKYCRIETQIFQQCRKIMVEYNDWKKDSNFAKPNKQLIGNNIKGFGKMLK